MSARARTSRGTVDCFVGGFGFVLVVLLIVLLVVLLAGFVEGFCWVFFL